MIEELVKDSLGWSEASLDILYGIEITDEENGEVALMLHGTLFSTYDSSFELPHLVSDIDYIIREEIY